MRITENEITGEGFIKTLNDPDCSRIAFSTQSKPTDQFMNLITNSFKYWTFTVSEHKKENDEDKFAYDVVCERKSRQEVLASIKDAIYNILIAQNFNVPDTLDRIMVEVNAHFDSIDPNRYNEHEHE
jgi:hypothetical protein